MRFVHSGFVLVILSGLLDPIPARADTVRQCSCATLESLQQDYQNTVYLERFYRDLAKSLTDWEATQYKLVKDPNNPVNVSKASREKGAQAAKDAIFLPFPQVTGQTGPMSVEMAPLTCIQLQGQLAELDEGAPCEGMAAAELAHLQRQRDLCTMMGAAVFWDRPGSAFAAEKAESLKKKAANLRSEIGNALDSAEVTIRGEWPYTVTMPGMEMEYGFEFATTDFGKSTSDDKSWTFAAQGETLHSLKGVSFEGLSCSGDGKVVNEFTVKLKTDGLTLGLEFDGRLEGGSHAVTCAGTRVDMPPSQGSGWGQFDVAALPLRAGDTDLPTNWTEALMPLGGGGILGMMSGISVSGEAKSVLSVRCNKP